MYHIPGTLRVRLPAQGVLLLSPSIDVPRTLVLRVMAAIQSVILPLAPFWRVVPSPPIEIVTADIALVRTTPDC